MPDTEAPAIQRPVAVTIIAWLSIGFGIFFSLIYTYGLTVITGIQAAICHLVILFLNTSQAIAFFRKPGAEPA